jgi:Holliday junction resolvase
MNNKILGSKFEQDFAAFLANQGYWVHFLEGAAHTGAQPFDLIAIKDNIPHCIDCKTLSEKSRCFPTSRIEDNQLLAYKRYKKCGNDNFSLAILWKNDVYIVPFNIIDFTAKSFEMSECIPVWRNFYEDKD